MKQALQHPAQIPTPPRQKPLAVLGTPWDMSKHPKATLIDHFAGIGGATTGARRCLERRGYKVGETLRIITVNHDPDAVANHVLNHPEAEHHCCPLETLEPRLAVLGHVCDECKDLVITKPCPSFCECGHYDRDHHGIERACPTRTTATGDPANFAGIRGERVTVLVTCAPCQDWSGAGLGPYKRPQLRATPDYSRRWRQILQPLVVIEENVARIRKLWTGYKAHLSGYKDDGYRAEDRVLNAADYATPQDRKRLIIMAIARDFFGDKQPVPWPKKTHSKRGREPGTPPWLPVLPCLDFDEPAPSFFDGRKTDGEPYAQNVRDRLARYLRTKSRFYEPLAGAIEAFSGRVPLADALNACPEDEWPAWIARQEDGSIVLAAERFLVHQMAEGECRSVQEPSFTHLTAGYHRLAEVRCVLPLRGPHGGPYANAAYDPAERPGHAMLAGKGGGNLAEGRVIAILPGGGSGAPARDASEPGNTVTHGGAWVAGVEVRMKACEPVILPHHGEDKKRGQLPRYHETTKPCPTAPASRRFDVAFPAIVTYHGKNTDTRSATRTGPTVATKNQHYVFYLRVEDRWVGPFYEIYLDLAYRQLTVRETARIQGFDDTLQLTGTITAMQRGIGNAVPPPLIDACLSSVFQMRGIHRPTLNDFGGAVA